MSHMNTCHNSCMNMCHDSCMNTCHDLCMNTCHDSCMNVSHAYASWISVICTMTHIHVFHMNMCHASFQVSHLISSMISLSICMCDSTHAYVPWLILVYSLKPRETHYKGEAQKKNKWGRKKHRLVFFFLGAIAWAALLNRENYNTGGRARKIKKIDLVDHVAAKSWHHGFTGVQNKFYDNLQGRRRGEKKKIVLRWTIWRQETTSWFGHSSHNSAEQVLSDSLCLPLPRLSAGILLFWHTWHM